MLDPDDALHAAVVPIDVGRLQVNGLRRAVLVVGLTGVALVVAIIANHRGSSVATFPLFFVPALVVEGFDRRAARHPQRALIGGLGVESTSIRRPGPLPIPAKPQVR